MAVSMIGPKFYAWDSNTGKPLAFGKVYTYQAGTNTPKATFTTEGGETQNANPVILNGAGYADIYLNGSYKIVVKNADDVEVWTSDPVSDPSQLQQEWVRQRNITQVNTTTFTVDGGLTDEYVKGVAIRVKQDSGFVFGTVVSATYADGKTTVELSMLDGATISSTAQYAERNIVAAFSSLGSDLVSHTGTSDTVTQALDKRTIYVGSVAELQAIDTAALKDGQQVSVSGIIYGWEGAKWVNKSGYVTPEMFGAVGDGVTDDTDAFQAAVDAYSHVRVTGRKTYLIDPRRTFIRNPGNDYYAGINLPSGCRFVMDPGVTLKIPAQSQSWYGIIGCQGAENIYIEGGILVGDRDTNTSGGGEHGYGVTVVSSSNVVVNRVTATGCYGDGFFVGPANHLDPASRCRAVLFKDCIADNNRRQGLSVTGCVGLTVRGGKYSNSNGTPPQCGIDLEPDNIATISEDCLISGVEFSDNGHSGLMNTSSKNVTIENCVFRNHPRGHLYITSQIDLIVTGCHFDSPGAVLRIGAGTGSEKNIEISNCQIRHSIAASENSYLVVTPGSNMESYMETLSIHDNQFMIETGVMGTLRMNQAEGSVARIQNNHFTFGPTYSGSFLNISDNKAYRISGNTFHNKGPNSLIPSIDSTSFYTVYDGGNTYQGLFNREHIYFRSLGDFHAYIDTASVAAGAVFEKNENVVGAKLGDVVTITPLAAVGVGHIQAKVVVDGSIKVTFYNFSTTVQNYTGDYAITLSRST